MNIIFGCEESQACTIEFRKKGHNAFSCDLKDCTGGHPEWHLKMDLFQVVKGGIFVTQAGDLVEIKKWDMGVFFPPCTDLAVSGTRSFAKKRANGKQQKSIDFFMRVVNIPIEKTVIENPVGIMSTEYRKPDQIIHPYFFGDEVQKSTCLWLKKTPKLFHAKKTDLFNDQITHVGKGEFYEWTDTKTGKQKRMSMFHAAAKGFGKKQQTKEYGEVRSKTFPGIAKAMADQWG